MYHLSHFALATPDKVAVHFLDSGEAYSFSRLEREANRAANALQSIGLKRNDCIVLCIENSPALLFLALGAQRIGLYYVLASTRLSAADLEYIVKDSMASVAIVSSACMSAEAVRSLDVGRARLVCIGFAAAPIERWEARFLAASHERPTALAPGREMLYSSGTTGRPKGVRKPPFEDDFDAVDNRNAAVARSFALDSSSIYLSTSPLYHSAPNRFLSAAIHAGATSIVMEKFDAERSLAAIARFECTHSLWVPTMFHRLLRLEADVRNRYSMTSMVRAVHGAAPCPVHVKQAMIDWWGPVLDEYYSGTEGIGATAITSREWLMHRGSVGRATDGILHILDDAGHELPAGKTGQIFFESDARFEYWNDPSKTRAVTSAQGWRSFGDIGHLDREGYLYLTDRKDFVIISGGVNIYPQEIEDVLLQDSRVADAAVFGVPNEEYGEEVKAVIQPAHPDFTVPVMVEALKARCLELLGPIKTPRTIDFEFDFPRQATGKLYKKQLRDRYLTAGSVPPSST
ncbi:AMP-binding protein [Variovorax sp. RT4R15]|uniref:AMP-binding protein n=1 Tax=Variovorax sp. RT4R15 TaxID=3443737 RepID=UPI003F44A0AF